MLAGTLTDNVELGAALEVLLALVADGHNLDVEAELCELLEASLSLRVCMTER